jgi:hypothetical protein
MSPAAEAGFLFAAFAGRSSVLGRTAIAMSPPVPVMMRLAIVASDPLWFEKVSVDEEALCKRKTPDRHRPRMRTTQ